MAWSVRRSEAMISDGLILAFAGGVDGRNSAGGKRRHACRMMRKNKIIFKG